MNVKIIHLILLLLFLTGQSIAQEKMSLEDCIAYAHQHNLQLNSKAISNTLLKENYNQSKRNLLPSIGAGTSHGMNFGRYVDQTENKIISTESQSHSFSVSGSIDIFKGFQKQNLIRYNKLRLLAGLKDKEQQQFNIAFEVISAYYDVQYYQGLIAITREQLAVSKMKLDQSIALAKTGKIARTDVVEIEANLAQEEYNKIDVENRLNLAILQLKQVMNFPQHEKLLINYKTATLLTDEIVNENSVKLYEVALTHVPTIKEGELLLSSSKKNLAMTRSNLLPSLKLSGSYGTRYSDTQKDATGNARSLRDQLKSNANQSVGLSVSIPLFSRLSGRSEVKKAKLNMVLASNELDIRKQNLLNEIVATTQLATAYQRSYVQAIKQNEAAKLAFEVADKKLKQGLINIVEYYSAKYSLASSESRILQTALQYKTKARLINFYKGIPIY
ncbi:TolC family protein [Puteibacter caeruleilacunae]|nr:TolC family protein [Puteibacter caeruleilacunae]